MKQTSTKLLNGDLTTIGVENTVTNDYFQEDYFQSDYFQTGTINLSGNTGTSTTDLNLVRKTVQLLD